MASGTSAKRESAKISDEAVRAKTGKVWKEWFSILDRWGARKKGHKATARWLHERHGLGPWWSQMVTVCYERERGLRELGQQGGHYVAGVQRTIRTPARKAYEAFTQPEMLGQWFTTQAKADLRLGGRYSNGDGDQGTFLLLKPPRALRFTWENSKHCPGTLVDVTFAPAGIGRVVVRVEHSRLASRKDFEDMKRGWSWAMDCLRLFLETGRRITYEKWLEAKGESVR